MNTRRSWRSIAEYIRSFPPPVRRKLSEMRAIIRKNAPDAEEKISYQIPTYFLQGNLVHFAGYARHIGFYPAASGIAMFGEELKGYKSAKGSVQFPLDKPLPAGLIGRIVRFRVGENRKRTRLRKGKR